MEQNLSSGILMPKEVEQSIWGDIEPNRSSENHWCTWRLSRFIHVILHHDSDVWGISHLSPWIVCGRTHISTKCFHHSICQFQQTSPPSLGYKNCWYISKETSKFNGKHTIYIRTNNNKLAYTSFISNQWCCE